MREFLAHFNACKAPECMFEAMFMYTSKRGCRDDLRIVITVQHLMMLEEVFTLAVAVYDIYTIGSPHGGGQKGIVPQTKRTFATPAKGATKHTCSHCQKSGHNNDTCY